MTARRRGDGPHLPFWCEIHEACEESDAIVSDQGFFVGVALAEFLERQRHFPSASEFLPVTTDVAAVLLLFLDAQNSSRTRRGPEGSLQAVVVPSCWLAVQ
jgi:hypothetical protein